MNLFKSGILSISTAFLLTACGSSSSSSGDTGILLDGILSGVKYVNGTAQGYTDANGNFPYNGGLVEFYVGSIKIGEVSSLPTDKKVYIQDLVGVSRTDTTNTNVLMIGALVQHLDSDETTDAIEIDSSIHNQFTEYTSMNDFADFAAVTNYLRTKLGNTKSIRTESDVEAHLNSTLISNGELSDTTSPSLVSSDITDGDTGVAIDSRIVLRFSEPIPREFMTSSYFTLVDNNSNPIATTITEDSGYVTIRPISDLSYDTQYTCEVNTTLEDFAGNTVTFPTIVRSFSFRTEAQPADTIAPFFTSATSFSVAENQTSAFTAVATDSSTITYSLSGTDVSSFSIDSTTGVVTFVSAPDYETKTSYLVTVSATDSSNNIATQNITVNITDVNETIPDTTAPVFSSLPYYYVAENQTSAFTAVATDETSSVTYSLLSNPDAVYFNIDSSTGVVTFITAPDYETKNGYYIRVLATDASSNTSYINVTVNITDVNETVPDTTAPVFTSATSFSVAENQTSAFTAVATDSSTITYSLSGTDASSFSIDSTTGVVTFLSAPDYETKTSYLVTVNATDSSNNVATQNVTVNITDVNEVVPGAPIFSVNSPLSTPENSYATISVAATSSSNSTITYSLGGVDSNYFDIGTSTGLIAFKNGMSADYETKDSYSVDITATDASSRATTQTFVINITDQDEFTFNGKTYGEITSPSTGRIWLDRNLGADNVCYDKNDTSCNGDFYQWGRLADGHQLSTAQTTIALANTYPTVGHGDFISTTSGNDWLNSGVDDYGTSRAINWANTTGAGVCPVGYKVPTASEFIAEVDNSIIPQFVGFYPFGYHTFLKLGQNFSAKSPNQNLGLNSSYWVLDRDTNQIYSKYYNVSTGSALSAGTRQAGMPIRCIQAQ